MSNRPRLAALTQPLLFIVLSPTLACSLGKEGDVWDVHVATR